MAESFVQLNNDGPGKKIDTFTEATAGQHRQAMVVSDPSVTGGTATVDPILGLSVNPKALPPNAAQEAGGNLASMKADLDIIKTNTTQLATTQPVSLPGSVTVIQPIGTNLHTVVDNFPAIQTVSGTVSTTLSDTTPATANVTVQDTSTITTSGANSQPIYTGSPTVGSVATFSLSAINSIEIQVTGTWTGTLQSEVSMDGGTTWYKGGGHQKGVTFNSSAFTSNFQVETNVAGFTNWRLRAITAWTGTATVRVVETTNSASLYITSPIGIVSGDTTGNQAIVKSASTSAVTADPALVVAISPNNAVTAVQPVGTNFHVVVDSAPTTPVTGTFFQTTQPVSAASLPLPTGAATAANQTNGSQETQIVQGGNTAVVDATGDLQVDVNNFPASQVVSQPTAANLNATVVGTVTANQGTANATPWTENLTQVAGATVSTAASGTQKVGVSGSTAATLDAVITAATAPANGLAILTVAQTTPPSLTAGQSVAVQCDYAGSAFVKPYRRSQVVSKATTIAASTTATTVLAAQGAGIFADISTLVITTTPAATTSTAYTVTLSDGTNSYIFDLTQGLATAAGEDQVNISFNPPLPATTANTAWTVTNSTATPTNHITVVAVLQKAS